MTNLLTNLQCSAICAISTKSKRFSGEKGVTMNFNNHPGHATWNFGFDCSFILRCSHRNFNVKAGNVKIWLLFGKNCKDSKGNDPWWLWQCIVNKYHVTKRIFIYIQDHESCDETDVGSYKLKAKSDISGTIIIILACNDHARSPFVA